MSKDFLNALEELKEAASSANLAFTHFDALAAEMGVKANATVQDEEWDGEGLPPAGVECEHSIYGTGWYKCTIEHWLEKTNDVVYWVPHLNKYQTSHRHTNFRPLRTERQKAVEEMMKHGSLDPEEFCEALYDAGYRKQEDV